MNSIFQTKWNATIGAWVACSEIAKAVGKAKVATRTLGLLFLSAFTAGQALAFTCTAATNGNYLVGSAPNIGCDTIDNAAPVSLTNTGFYILDRNRSVPLSVKNDIDVTAVDANGFAGIGTQYFTNTIAIKNANFNVRANSNSAGFEINTASTLTGRNVTMNTTAVATAFSGGETYGLLAGSSVRAGATTNTLNDKFSTIVLDNYSLTQTTSGGFSPQLNSGIRVIQGGYRDNGFGDSGYVAINEKLTMNLTGQRLEGIYASGAGTDATGNKAVSQVHVKDSDITLHGISNSIRNDNSAIKLGKARAIGTGEGELYSTGNMKIDASGAIGHAIKIAVSGSKLQADYATSSADILANKSALAIGVDDWGTSTDSSGISAAFNNAKVRTVSTTDSLVLVDGGQQDVSLLFTGTGSDLLAAQDGYLLDIVNLRNRTTSSSVRANFDNGSTITGLTNKQMVNSTLNIGLGNGATWNLAEKATGATTTATFDALNMTGASVLNAFKNTGTAAFILAGNISSSSSTLSLNDQKAGDVLSIHGSYVGDESALKLDTSLGDDASITDMLVVTGDTTGRTYLDIYNAGGLGAMTNNGIEVVRVGGSSAMGSFLLRNNMPVSINGFDYYLYQGLPPNDTGDPVTNNDWYLRSVCSNGSSTTGGNTVTTSILGCASNDAIVVQEDVVAGAIEGAGGTDTIQILGNASVTGGVYGGGQGKDNSVATDTGDTITIDTSGTVNLVDGGMGDDTINWTSGSVGSITGGGAGTVFDQNGSDTLFVSAPQYNGNQLLDGGDDASAEDGQIDTLIFNGITATVDGANLTNWELIKLEQETLLTLDGTLNTGIADALGNPLGLSIDATSTLAVGGPTTAVVGDVANTGVIDLHFADTAPRNTLSIYGDYTGTAGSKLLVDSTWNDANALTTDTLEIHGSAFGSTAVSVPGGILGNVTQADQAKVSDKAVITVSGSQNGNVFTGSAPTTNAGEAQLVRVGNNYYWSLLAKRDPSAPKFTQPIYVPETSVYQQTALINKEMGFSQLGKLHERVGEQQTWVWDDCNTRCTQYQQFKDKDDKKYPVWGRLNGDYLKLQGDDRFAFKSKTGFLQFGVDINNTFNAQNGSRRHSGAMFTYGWGSADYFDKYRAENGVVVNDKYAGNANMNMFSLGGYSTWYAQNGTYFDLVGNVSWIRNKYSSRAGVHASQSGYGLGLSAEVGRPWQMGNSQWLIEPQVQLSYQYIRLNDFQDNVREIKNRNLNGLRGRIGGRLAWNDRYSDQLRTKTFYLTANVLHDFAGNRPTVTMGRENVGEKHASIWGELGLGGQLALSKATYLYADVRYQRSFDSSKGALGSASREGYNGRIGMRYTW